MNKDIYNRLSALEATHGSFEGIVAIELSDGTKTQGSLAEVLRVVTEDPDRSHVSSVHVEGDPDGRLTAIATAVLCPVPGRRIEDFV